MKNQVVSEDSARAVILNGVLENSLGRGDGGTSQLQGVEGETARGRLIDLRSAEWIGWKCVACMDAIRD